MSNPNQVVLEFFLPCGHMIRLINVTYDELDAKHLPQFLEYSANVLNRYAQARSEKHRCELVTEDNPHGLPRLS